MIVIVRLIIFILVWASLHLVCYILGEDPYKWMAVLAFGYILTDALHGLIN